MNKEIDCNNFKILHYHMNSAYMVDGGYLENIMSKFHKQKYRNTIVLTTNKELMKDGSIEYVNPGISEDANGVKLIRVDISKFKFLKNTSALDGLVRFRRIYEVLKSEAPDFIIAGGVGSLSNFPIAKYVRKNNPHCIVVCRSHATVENVDRHNHQIKRRIWDYILSLQNKYMNRYYKRVYGILPSAIDYMVTRFGIPEDKAALLPLGYDDTLIDFGHQEEIRARVRKQYGIDEDAYLVVHGGKLSAGKKTMEFVKSLRELDKNIAAVVFGDFGAHNYGESVTNQYEVEVKEEADKDTHHKIVFSGSLNQNEIYDLYLAADLAVFPGAPSCLRQEAVGSGIPVIMYVNPGDEGININICNNAIYLPKKCEVSDITDAINAVYNDSEYRTRAEMLANSQYKEFSYRNLSDKIIEDNI